MVRLKDGDVCDFTKDGVPHQDARWAVQATETPVPAVTVTNPLIPALEEPEEAARSNGAINLPYNPWVQPRTNPLEVPCSWPVFPSTPIMPQVPIPSQPALQPFIASIQAIHYPPDLIDAFRDKVTQRREMLATLHTDSVEVRGILKTLDWVLQELTEISSSSTLRNLSSTQTMLDEDRAWAAMEEAKEMSLKVTNQE